MIQRAEQANIVGLRSKDFVQWVGENIDAPMKRGPGGAVLERLKAGLGGEFFNWAKRNSTWALGFASCAARSRWPRPRIRGTTSSGSASFTGLPPGSATCPS